MPPRIVVAPTEPPARLAVPAEIYNVPRLTCEVKSPPVIFDSPATFPLVRLVFP